MLIYSQISRGSVQPSNVEAKVLNPTTLPRSLRSASPAMLGASFLPARFRSDHGQSEPYNPGYINKWITPYLQSISRSAFTHPIHTIVFIALLASTSYIGILEGSLLEHTSVAGGVAGSTDFASLTEGSRRLRLGQGTSWKWQNDNDEPYPIIINTVCFESLRYV